MNTAPETYIKKGTRIVFRVHSKAAEALGVDDVYLERLMVRFLAKIEEGAGDCWLWTAAKHGKGYGHFKIRNRVEKAHRLAAVLEKGIPHGLHVCHACDVPSCVNPLHLFLGTNAENMADRNRKGRASTAHGADNGNSKLTRKQALDVRRLHRLGQTQLMLSKGFGLSISQVNRIVNRKAWAHLPETHLLPTQSVIQDP